MTFNTNQIAALSAKLDASNVKRRPDGARHSYIEGWLAIAEANRIFGFHAWSRETVEIKQVHEPYRSDDDKKWVVGYMAKVLVRVVCDESGHWIHREGCGFGSGIDRDLGRAHESAFKEAETDAMKRALMTFGNPFGLALYDKTQEGVDHEPHKPLTKPVEKGPVNRLPMIAPAPTASEADWKGFARAVVGAAEFAQTVEDLREWEIANAKTFARIREKSVAAHDNIRDRIEAHAAKLTAGRAA